MTPTTVQRQEIEVRLSSLLGILVVVLVGLAALIGYQTSPYVGGRPVLLNRQNYQIKQYLDQTHHWLAGLKTANNTLGPILPPTEPGEVDDGTPGPDDRAYPTPMARPGDVYALSRTARQAQDALLAVKREVERTNVPETMIGLHSLVINAVDAHLALTRTTLESIAAPTSAAAALATKEQADQSLRLLEDALVQQDALLRND